MADPFDPYHKWLGISPKHQPPDHYRLLGLGHFETDGDVIDMAAARQLAHVRTFQNGPQGPKTHKLLNEIAAARLCLLDPSRKQVYDRQLRDQLEAAGRLTSEIPLEQVQSLVSSAPPAPALLASPEPPPSMPVSAQTAQPAPVATRWKVSPEMEPPTAEDVALVPLPVVAPPVVIAPPALHPSAGAALPRLNLTPAALRPAKEQTFLAPILLIAGLSLTAVVCVVGLVLAFSAPGGVAQKKKQPAAPNDTSLSKPAAQSPLVAAQVNPVPSPANPALAPAPARAGQTPTPFPLGGAAPPEPSRSELARLDRPRPGRLPGLPPPPRPPTPPLSVDEARERAAKLLVDARQALADRDDERSVQLLIDAEQLATQHRERLPPSLLADAEHLRAVYESVKKFWSAVRDGAYQKTSLGEKILLRKNLLTLEARAGDELVFTLDGGRQTLSIRRLPPEAAVVFALRSFGPEDAWGQAHCALFLAVDGKSANPRAQREARNLAREAAAKLGSSATVLQREFGPALQTPSEEEPLVKSPEPAPTPAPSLPAAPAPAPAPAPPVVLDSPAFREAKTDFEAATREFRRKVYSPAADPAALLAEFEPQLASAQTPLVRYLRLDLALQIAAKAGDCPRIMKWGAEAAQLLGQPAVEQQGRFLLLCTPQTEEQRTAYFELLATAITQAEALSELDLALRLAAHGKQTALNARNSGFVQQFTDRAKALEQLQKSRAAGASSALLPPLRRG